MVSSLIPRGRALFRAPTERERPALGWRAVAPVVVPVPGTRFAGGRRTQNYTCGRRRHCARSQPPAQVPPPVRRSVHTTSGGAPGPSSTTSCGGLTVSRPPPVPRSTPIVHHCSTVHPPRVRIAGRTNPTTGARPAHMRADAAARPEVGGRPCACTQGPNYADRGTGAKEPATWTPSTKRTRTDRTIKGLARDLRTAPPPITARPETVDRPKGPRRSGR